MNASLNYERLELEARHYREDRVTPTELVYAAFMRAGQYTDHLSTPRERVELLRGALSAVAFSTVRAACSQLLADDPGLQGWWPAMIVPHVRNPFDEASPHFVPRAFLDEFLR